MLIAYIIAINFYAFLQIKSMRDNEELDAIRAEVKPEAKPDLPSTDTKATETTSPANTKQPQRNLGKLFITALLGGAITIYACMFLFKYKRSDLLLMVLLPLLGVLNVYFWILLFRSGFSFFLLR